MFKGWEVVTVGTDGLPFQDYSLPVEYIGGQYMLEFSTAEYSYIFRIKAVFEEGPTPITLDVQHYNKNGTINTDSTITASPTTAYAGGRREARYLYGLQHAPGKALSGDLLLFRRAE